MMGTPRSITPIFDKPLSVTPPSRVLRSPLTDHEIWSRLKQAGFHEESIKHKDKAALVAYVAKLEAEIYDHQHHMGLLILERKELASKYEEVKASAESSELLHEKDSAVHLSALSEAKKQEKSLKKTIEVKEECIASLEKSLSEMRAECAETKVAADCKLAEAHCLIDEAQKKSTEAEAKMHTAESLQEEASRYNLVAERNLKEVEAREDDLRRRIISFKSECDEKEKAMILERQSLSERQNVLQQEQERLLEAQALLNQREDHIFSRSQELNQIKKELEDAKDKIEKEHRVLNDEKTNLELKEATLRRREEELSKKEADLNKKEHHLLDFQVKLASRESDETEKVIAAQEAEMRTRKFDFEAELQRHKISVENEIGTKRRVWELKEFDLKQQEDHLIEREHELGVLSRALAEREKDLTDMSRVLEEKDQKLRAAEKEFELNKTVLLKEKEEIDKTKQDLQKSFDSLDSKIRQVDHANERLEALKTETDDLSVFEVKLKEEIDLVRFQELDLLAEADKLKAEKAKFEAEWEILDEKREELWTESKRIAEDKMAVSKFIKDERENLRKEKDALRKQYKEDFESLAREREEFMNKMALEHADWVAKMQQERLDFLQDIEMQKRELDNLIEKRRQEVERFLKEREQAFEQVKNNELQSINDLKEKAAKELEQVSFQIKRLHAERTEINLDRERRNKEWAELNNCIEELKVQRDKLQKQRELLHADRIEIHTQTEELKKLQDLKVVSDDVALIEMLKSDMESRQQKISARRNLKPHTLMLGDALNSPIEIGSSNISSGFDTPVQNLAVVSPPRPLHFSWIKRCTELIFRHSPEKPLMKNDGMPLLSDSNGPKHSENGKSVDNFSKSQQMKFPCGEPKVVVEVPPTAEFRKDVKGKDAPSISDQCHMGNRKRDSGNSTFDNGGDPIVNQRQIKKLRPEEYATGNSVVMVDNPEDAHVVMVDKVVHITEVTCEKIDALSIPNEENRDDLQNPTIEMDQ
ncbi:protein CROWDED NUCLEI 4 [Senna tora]|uniref:Protein CROWDED NUCLEI 4 n=1 Tax=Senna tora TaxID=362788 RepID=A0A834TXK2_9FABA|nr:protein CROWDED NUCLEI 4 [Senna tora]